MLDFSGSPENVSVVLAQLHRQNRASCSTDMDTTLRGSFRFPFPSLPLHAAHFPIEQPLTLLYSTLLYMLCFNLL